MATSQAAPDPVSTAEGAVERVGRYRWTICGLLFAATAINYVDRQMIGVLKPVLQPEFGWTETTYADIVFWFQAAYMVSYLFFGRVVDLLGARVGYAIAFVIWTAAHMAHGLASSTLTFTLARAGLGVGEAGNFPAGLKAVAEWFPQKERALATGIFNAGSNVGAVVTPLLVPVLVGFGGWRFAFVATGVFSIVWLIAWLAIYRRPHEHKGVTAPELAYIQADSAFPAAETLALVPEAKMSVRAVLARREAWAYILGKFLTDPIWWLFLFWLPDFLGKRYGLDLKGFGYPLATIYLISDVGSVAGGWSSSRLIHRGWSVNLARKLTMLGCAVLVLPVFAVQYVPNVWGAVAIIGLATAAHQAWSANLYTLPSDMFPRTAVGTVIGIGGAAGALGGMLMSKFTGYILDTTGSYAAIFVVAGSVYLIALAVIHALSPRLARVEA